MEIELTKQKLGPLAKYLPIWSVVSFLVISIGYIGYFTFCSLNNIPYNQPNIYTLVGIGVFNLIYWIVIIIAGSKGGKNYSFRVISIVGVLYWLTFDPEIWGLLTFLYLFLSSDFGIQNLFKSKKNKNIENSPEISKKPEGKWQAFKLKYLDIFIDTLVLGFTCHISIIYDLELIVIFAVVIFSIFEVEKILATRRLKLYHLFLVIIAVPSFLTYTILNKGNYSLIGISKSTVELQLKNNLKFKAILVYQDSENLYLKDSIDSKSTHSYPKSSVVSMKIESKYKVRKNKLVEFKENDYLIQTTKEELESIDTNLYQP